LSSPLARLQREAAEEARSSCFNPACRCSNAERRFPIRAGLPSNFGQITGLARFVVIPSPYREYNQEFAFRADRKIGVPSRILDVAGWMQSLLAESQERLHPACQPRLTYPFFGISATRRIDVVRVSSWKGGRR